MPSFREILAVAALVAGAEARLSSRGLADKYAGEHCNNVPNRAKCFEKDECFFQDGWCHVRPVDPEFGPLPETAAPTAAPTLAPRPPTCAEEPNSRECRSHYGCKWSRGACEDIDISPDIIDCATIERRDCDVQWECAWARREGCIDSGELIDERTCDEMDDDLRACSRNAHCASIYWYNATDPSCVPIELFPELECEHLDEHSCVDAVGHCDWSPESASCTYAVDT